MPFMSCTAPFMGLYLVYVLMCKARPFLEQFAMLPVISKPFLMPSMTCMDPVASKPVLYECKVVASIHH